MHLWSNIKGNYGQALLLFNSPYYLFSHCYIKQFCFKNKITCDYSTLATERFIHLVSVNGRGQKKLKKNVKQVTHLCKALLHKIKKKLTMKKITEIKLYLFSYTIKCLRNQGRTKGEGWSTEN